VLVSPREVHPRHVLNQPSRRADRIAVRNLDLQFSPAVPVCGLNPVRESAEFDVELRPRTPCEIVDAILEFMHEEQESDPLEVVRSDGTDDAREGPNNQSA
jgi:hypothetical protein